MENTGLEHPGEILLLMQAPFFILKRKQRAWIQKWIWMTHGNLRTTHNPSIQNTKATALSLYQQTVKLSKKLSSHATSVERSIFSAKLNASDSLTKKTDQVCWNVLLLNQTLLNWSGHLLYYDIHIWIDVAKKTKRKFNLFQFTRAEDKAATLGQGKLLIPGMK